MLYNWIKIFLVVQVALILIFSGVTYIVVSNEQYNCMQLERLKTGTRQQIINSNSRLPKIQYYKDHPEELKTAIQTNNELLQTYGPNACTGVFGG